ncbi:MAG: hypothetical protein E6G02_06325 [Actinobacteria bacterium]|nr:MAG: hypothetical protein E6G02_06325 [Actinomycetota bacterium]
MSTLDLLVERGAERLENLSRKAAAKGGFAAKLADELAEDAAFLRKLKPSLIKARAKGRADHAPIARASDREPEAPSAPQIAAPRPKPKAKKNRRGRPNPFLVAGVALAAGIAIAKVIDWRGHAHPRD